jgi:hypothetical protein
MTKDPERRRANNARYYANKKAGQTEQQTRREDTNFYDRRELY